MSANTNLRPAIFLDRDGTLNEVVYNQDGMEDSPFRPEDLMLLPGPENLPGEFATPDISPCWPPTSQA